MGCFYCKNIAVLNSSQACMSLWVTALIRKNTNHRLDGVIQVKKKENSKKQRRPQFAVMNMAAVKLIPASTEDPEDFSTCK